MKLTVDLHTHTIASNHAYCTIREMAKMAAEKGVTLLGFAEHTPGVFGCCDPMYFCNIKVIPRELYGVKLMIGGELNIIDYEGSLSLDEKHWNWMDMRIAGMHSHSFTAGTKTQNMNAIMNAIANPWVDIICHPDDGQYDFDYEAIVLQAKRYGTLLELNNNALNPNQHRKNAHENYVSMLNFCKKHDVPILMSSDAHFDVDIARCDFSSEIVKETQFPHELIANINQDLLYAALDNKRMQRGNM